MIQFITMQNDLISIDPEVIQFNRENCQTIKITNNTQQPLNNFFFCLYNVEKFTFKPQTFSLMPKQHKLVEITLKIKSTKSIAKQFAYLKSTQVNKRLTLLINNFSSPQVRVRQTEEMSDMNTLSSRDYHELHNRALNKIIQEQHKLEVSNNVRQFTKTDNFSIGSSGKKEYFNSMTAKGDFYVMDRSNRKEQQYDEQYIREMQKRSAQLQKQVQELNQVVSRGNFQMEKIDHENRFLSEQGAKLMKKISQKQMRIKQLQTLYEKIVQENSSYNTEVRELKQTLQRQRQLSRQAQRSKAEQLSRLYSSYQSRIKQLEHVVESSQRNSLDKFNNQFRKRVQEKDRQLMEIRKALEHQQLLLKQHQINLMKTQSENQTLKEKKRLLDLQNAQLNQLNNNLKEEIFVYKSRIDQQPNNTQLQQYLEIALESYKTQNQNLKKSKFQLEKSLEGIINTQRQTQVNNNHMHSKIQSLNKELGKLQHQLTRQQQIKEQIKSQHHQKIKQITQKNILLLQNLTLQSKSKRQQQAARLKKQLSLKDQQINQINTEYQQEKNQLLIKIKKLQKENQKVTQLEEQNTNLQEKVKKYKKQTRKQLKSINDNAFDQLRRIHDEKKSLQKKVVKLEKMVFKLEGNPYSIKNDYLAGTSDVNSKSQMNSKSQVNQEEDESDNTETNRDNVNMRSRSQYQATGNRRVGIFNQRHHLYDSRSASTKNALISPNLQKTNAQVPNYELFELREFTAFVHNEQQRFQYMFNLQSELVDPLDYQGKPLHNIKPLYKAIKFFKVIENKLKSMTQKAEQSLILTKQNAFIRQKLAEYERIENTEKQENRKDISNITVTNPMMRIQQEDGPSFFIHRTNLTNLNAFQMIEFLKGEMKKQYNKQVQNIKFIEEKHEILKKKIYIEYRTRIIEIINESQGKKDKPANLITVTKLENLIQRFVQGLSNLSHKQAVLSKQIKIKNTYKNQIGKLRQKINQLQHLLNEKQHGYCNRDPIKVFNCSTFINNQTIKEEEWRESIKLSAQLLTQKAESQRLKEQLEVVRQDYNELKEQMNELLSKNDLKDTEIIKLKKNQLDLEKEYEKQLEKQNQILEETKLKLSSGGTKTKTKTVAKYEQKLKDKQKQIQVLSAQIEKKNHQLRTFKEKEKKWQEYINQTNRSEEKQKSLANSYRRIEENNAMIKQNNRELRQENNQLKDLVEKLQKELEKKKLYIKNLKSDEDQTRMAKPSRIQETQLQIKELEEALKYTKDQFSRIKKNKDREIQRLENDVLSAKNQSLIHIRSLQSMLRATLEAVKKIFGSLKIFAKKRGLPINVKQTQLNVPENLLSVNAAEIYEQFQEILQTLDK